VSGCAYTEYTLNGTTAEYSEPIFVDGEGRNDLQVQSVDNAGNREEMRNRRLGIDRGVPSATMETTNAVQVYIPGRPPTLRAFWTDVPLASGEDGSGVARMCFRINGAACLFGSADTDSSFAIRPNIHTGVYEVTATPTDQAGNVGATTPPFTFIVIG
jgi:hypothetical protein